MRYLALCTDYDGTLARHGEVAPETFSALERLIASGRKVVLVTGREIPDLLAACPRLDLFACVVAENGALLYDPVRRRETPLATAPPAAFVAALRERGVPLSVGRVVVATLEPHETAVLEVVRDLGLELQVIFNKGAVMVLPAGINKASGLAAALHRLGLSAHNTVGIGDAENDHALLAACECGAAVANALPALKASADIVTSGSHGAGVAEICEALLRDDLASHDPQRQHLLLGTDEAGRQRHVAPHGERLLILAPPGDSEPLVSGLLEQLVRRTYTFCAIAPQARHAELTGAVRVGEPYRAPSADEILELLRAPGAESVLVNLAAFSPSGRQAFVSKLAPAVAQLRALSGRPHWVLIEGADEQLPSGLPEELHTVVLTALDPAPLGQRALHATTLLMASGPAPHRSLEAFCRAASLPVPSSGPVLPPGAVLAWRPARQEPPWILRPGATAAEGDARG